MGILTIVLCLLIFIPFGGDSDSSSNDTNSDSTNIEDEKASMTCCYCRNIEIEKEGKKGVFCYTIEPDGIGNLFLYSGTRTDLYCSEKCALSAKIAGYGNTSH